MTTGAEKETRKQYRCPRCGGEKLSRQLIKSTFWHGERLVLVDDIPAFVCESCGERFHDEATARTLERMQGEGFAADEAKGHLHVPIISFSRRIPPELTEIAEEEE